jgi:hypothetical protein
MTKIVFALLVLITANVSNAKAITFSEVLVNKNIEPREGFVTGYLTLKAWCLKVGISFEVGNFQAAKELEKLADGLYRCEGKFARLPFQPVKAFDIEKCTAVNSVELRKDCKE